MEQEEAAAFAAKMEIPFFEISALSGDNVQPMFNEIAKSLTGLNVDLIK